SQITSPDLLSALVASASSFLISGDQGTLETFQGHLGNVKGNKEKKNIGKILLSLIPNLSLSDAPVKSRISGLLPPSWDTSMQSTFTSSLESAVSECREFRDRGGSLIVYTDDGKGHETKSVSGVETPSLRYTFGVTSATDLLGSVGKTFLRCEFNGEVVEMDVKGVYRMMAELERARNTMEILEGGE
ncbi:hypothetical protein TrRE_jg5182, partial [Triparma retinervis]